GRYRLRRVVGLSRLSCWGEWCRSDGSSRPKRGSSSPAASGSRRGAASPPSANAIRNSSSEVKRTLSLDTDSFGSCLRRAREQRRLTLKEVAGATKIPRATLELIEAGNIDELPADVFVRGFIRSYARLVGPDEAEPLHNFERALNARRDAERAISSTPVVPEPAA